MALVRPLVGTVWGYNSLVFIQLYASMLATWAMAREQLSPDRVSVVANRSAMVAAVAVGLAPMVLMYAVAGAVSDMLNIWPYPLAILFLVRAIRQGKARYAALSGLFAGLGFITCPYNVLVFLVLLPPAALALPIVRQQAQHWEKPIRILGRIIAAGALLTLLSAGGYAWQMQRIMSAENSQMSTEMVDQTRHSPPFPFLQPRHSNRYVGWLSDYVAIGKGHLIWREAGSRYYRCYSPGFLLIYMAIVAVRRRDRPIGPIIWLSMAVFAAVASTGPFLPWDGQHFAQAAINIPYLLMYYLGGGKWILEPFRYAIAASFALGLAATWGAAILIRQRLWLGWFLPGLVAFEVVIASPVPIPMPSMSLAVPEIYRHLDEYLPEGALLELPYFDKSTDRFLRIHFYYQLFHQRPIADEVLGFPPRYLVENAFTATLLAMEKHEGQLRVELGDAAHYETDRLKLSTDGFAGILLSAGNYATTNVYLRVRERLNAFGEPVYQDEMHVLYRLTPRP
jgi:hypothetical protein